MTPIVPRETGGATPQHSVTEQASIDTPEFHKLLREYANALAGVVLCEPETVRAEFDACKALVAHIDNRAQPLPSTATTQPEQAALIRAGWFIRENAVWVATSSDDPRATVLYRKGDALAIPASTAPKLPTNDEVYAEVKRERGSRPGYVSANAVNDVMHAVRALTASTAASEQQAVQQVPRASSTGEYPAISGRASEADVVSRGTIPDSLAQISLDLDLDLPTEATMANKIRRPAVARLAAKLQQQNPDMTDAVAIERAKSIVTDPNKATPPGAQTTQYEVKNGR